jgi:pyruvate dehydrogenase (quinone)
MSTTVADALLQRLKEWGVERIYGYPGDGINGIHAAQGRREEDGTAIPFVQARHEELAAFMATGDAKWSGNVGVCLATSGPGAIHLLNGLYDAKLDRQPVLAIVGAQATTAQGGSFQQEVDLKTLFKDVSSDYLVEVTDPRQLPMVVDRAFRTALSRRSPVTIIIPNNVQTMDYESPPHEFKMVPGSLGVNAPRITPPRDAIERAADILNQGERVAVLVGQGARGAADRVAELAELTGAGVAKALLGKDVLPDDLPYVTGPIGLLGSKPSWTLMQECDTLLMIGSSFPYSQFLPEWGQARGIQIDIDAHNIGLRYPMEENLVGDARLTLEELLPLVRRKEDRSWRETIEAEVREWWTLVEERAHLSADPINPQRVFWELSSRLPDDVIISADSGSGTNWFARDLKMRTGMRASLSGTLATMGPAVPYTIAAKFSHPDRPALACVGDGAMQMNGINGLITIAKYWQEWSDPRCVVLVLSNGDLNQVTWEMRAMGGFPKLESTQNLPAFDFAAYGRMLGLEGIKIEKEEEIGDAWDRAWRADRPVVVEAVVDPDVPPIPPHIELDEVTSLAKAILGGDPDTMGFAQTGAKQALQDILAKFRS